ncbi:unnamed protein product [Boreogadus saida]
MDVASQQWSELEPGFTSTPQGSGRLPAIVLTGLGYAEDLSLISEHVEQAQELWTRVWYQTVCSGPRSFGPESGIGPCGAGPGALDQRGVRSGKGWILKPTLQKSLDRCYTRKLHAILNINKNEHATNKHLQRAE